MDIVFAILVLIAVTFFAVGAFWSANQEKKNNRKLFK